MIPTVAYIASLVAVASVCITAVIAVARSLGDRITQQGVLLSMRVDDQGAHLGERIDDQAARIDRLEVHMDRAEARADERHEAVMAKLNGISETLARFDQRITQLEERAR